MSVLGTGQPIHGSQHAAILGLGAYRPSRVVPNADVIEAIDSSDEWIQQRSGIRQRRWATPEETVQMMSVAASRDAIAQAGIEPAQIDCVVVATVSHMLQTPAVATAIAYELGTERAAAFDISAACAGFCHGTDPDRCDRSFPRRHHRQEDARRRRRDTRHDPDPFVPQDPFRA